MKSLGHAGSSYLPSRDRERRRMAAGYNKIGGDRRPDTMGLVRKHFLEYTMAPNNLLLRMKIEEWTHIERRCFMLLNSSTVRCGYHYDPWQRLTLTAYSLLRFPRYIRRR